MHAGHDKRLSFPSAHQSTMKIASKHIGRLVRHHGECDAHRDANQRDNVSHTEHHELYRPRRTLLRPAELDFLTGLRAELFATDFLAPLLPADLFVAGLGFGAGFTRRFGLPRELAAAFLGFRTTFATFVTEEVTYSVAALPAAWTASFAPSRPDLATSSPACAVSTTVFVTVETMLSCSLSS